MPRNSISINFKTGKGSARGPEACRALLTALGVQTPPKDPSPKVVCKECNEVGMAHCAYPDECGNMNPPNQPPTIKV